MEPSTALTLLTNIWNFIRKLFKRRNGPKKSLVIQPVTNMVFGRYALWWSTANRGDQPGMQIVGDFYVSNATNEPRLITAVVLTQRYRAYRLIPRRRRILGDILLRAPDSNVHGNYPILPRATTSGRAMWFAFPPFTESGREFSARVCFIDSVGERHWTPRFRWYDIKTMARTHTIG